MCMIMSVCNIDPNTELAPHTSVVFGSVLGCRFYHHSIQGSLLIHTVRELKTCHSQELRFEPLSNRSSRKIKCSNAEQYYIPPTNIRGVDEVIGVTQPAVMMYV